MATKTQVRTDDVLNNLDNYQGLPIMGYTVMWRATGVDIDHDTLINLLTAQDFAKFAPDLPTAKRALRRAIVAWLKDRAKNSAAHATIDALDDDGADAVCAAVRELCRDRCVVVITHSPRLADALRTVPGRLVWVMNEGALHDES